ncbi:MAG: hypothetical protein GC181_13300 [Bacteroidetes bacterium]|nr:hypothetical protein [Bacteroidota bacterium]
MKSLKSFALLLALGAAQAFAQGPGKPHHFKGGPGHEMNIQKLDSILKLTDDQKAKIEALHKEQRDKMKAARESGQKPDREEMMKAMKENREKFMNILTPEQKQILEKKREEQKEKMKAMQAEIKTYRDTRIKPTMENLRNDFDSKLSDQERAKVTEVRAKSTEMREGFKKENVKAESSAPAEDDIHRGHRAGRLTPDQHKQIKTYVDSELKPILDAHKADLDKVAEDLKPLRATWKADMKAIRDKYIEPDTAKSNCGHCKKGDGKCEGGKGKGKGNGTGKADGKAHSNSGGSNGKPTYGHAKRPDESQSNQRVKAESVRFILMSPEDETEDR